VFKRKDLFIGCFAIGSLVASVSHAQIDVAQTRAKAARPQARAPATPPVVLMRSDADLFAATLAGRFAQGTDNPVLAAQAWTRAFMRRPTDGDIFARAIAANLQAGDVATAVRLSKMAAPALRNEDAAIALAVDAFAQGRFVDVTRALAGRTFQPSQRVFADHLGAYALLGQGKRDEAVALTSRATGIPALDKATLMSRAIILDGADRGSEAALLFQSALDSNIAWPLGVRTYGDWLIANDRKADAIAMYQRLARAGGLEASGFAAALAKVQSGGAPTPPQDLRASAATGLTTIAQSLAAEGRGGAPIGLFNLVAHLDPRSDGVAVALANQLISESRGNLAKPLLLRIKATSPDYLAARRELVWLVFNEDQRDAVDLARETLRAQPENIAASRLLADVLAANRDDSEAEALYSTLIDKSKAAGQSNEEAWPLYFGRGGSRERQGNWAGALTDLRFAKAAAPNQPNVLNYLGYAMADRGENIEEALGMLRTAVRLRPRSGSIMDSLGWAQFRAGRYEEAVATLETAASMSPSLAEITDHLGDAYWRTGREDEARMEWARALRLEATAAQKASIAIKLRDGLPPDPTVAARRALAAQTGSIAQR
jgi:Flp pilus assembly protein TadD